MPCKMSSEKVVLICGLSFKIHDLSERMSFKHKYLCSSRSVDCMGVTIFSLSWIVNPILLEKYINQIYRTKYFGNISSEEVTFLLKLLDKVSLAITHLGANS